MFQFGATAQLVVSPADVRKIVTKECLEKAKDVATIVGNADFFRLSQA
jgi:hypothetical protein